MSLSKALRRYISLPIASDQSAQLVPGLGGDKFYLSPTSTPCSPTKAMKNQADKGERTPNSPKIMFSTTLQKPVISGPT